MDSLTKDNPASAIFKEEKEHYIIRFQNECDYLISKKLTLILYDKHTSKPIGFTSTRDFYEKESHDYNKGFPNASISEPFFSMLYEKAICQLNKYEIPLQKGVIADDNYIAIHPDYRGRNLANLL